MLCSIPDCWMPIKNVRGYCSLHYQRWRRHGDPLAGRRLNGKGTISDRGYIILGGEKRGEHILVAEKALGRRLPARAEVHHVNEIKSDNSPENLVVCPDRAYHLFLHMRTNALNACGRADWRKCWMCQRYDDPLTMIVDKKKQKSQTFIHRECRRARGSVYRANTLSARAGP